MSFNAHSIRPFIGAKNYELARRFYKALEFEETILSATLSLFKTSAIAFYLQDYYVPDWINNTMVFVEVDDVDACWNRLLALNLAHQYEGVKLTPIRNEAWGRECFLHDPSGVLWHFGQFNPL